MDFKEQMHKLGTGLKALIRGMQGLPPDQQDIFSGLIDVNDIRERTRLPSIYELFAHEYMYLLKKFGGKEWAIYGEIVELDEHLFISLEGEQRKEAILMQRSKNTLNIQSPEQALALQQIDTSKKLGEKELPDRGEKK